MASTRPQRAGPHLRPLIMAGALAALSGCDPSAPEPAVPADLVLHNGRVVTMAADGSEGEAVAVADGLVLRVGSDAEVLALTGAETRTVDLEGRVVLPGIVDPHTHLFNDAWRLDRDLAGGQELLLANGITTAGNAFVNADFLSQIQAFHAAGELVVRTSLYLIYTDNCGGLQGDWWQQHPPTREFGERLRIGGVKLFMDGGTCGGTAVREPFADETDLGDLFLSQTEVAEAIRAVEGTGHQAVLHAIGDRAMETALDGIEAGLDGSPNDLRHRIDHNVFLAPDLIPRFAELGVQPVVFGPFLLFGRMVTDPEACAPTLSNEYYETSVSNLRALLDGVASPPPAWHGDDPWIGPISPFKELYLMVTRERRRASDGTIVCPAEPWQLATAITAAEGLRMMTTSSARALFREDEVGSLEPGKLADLIVVGQHPLEIEPDALWELEVDVTVVDGQVVHCRAGCW